MATTAIAASQSFMGASPEFKSGFVCHQSGARPTVASTIAPLRGRPASRIQRKRLFVVLGRRHKEPHDDAAISVWLVRDDELPMSVRQELLGFHLEQHLSREL